MLAEAGSVLKQGRRAGRLKSLAVGCLCCRLRPNPGPCCLHPLDTAYANQIVPSACGTQVRWPRPQACGAPQAGNRSSNQCAASGRHPAQPRPSGGGRTPCGLWSPEAPGKAGSLHRSGPFLRRLRLFTRQSPLRVPVQECPASLCRGPPVSPGKSTGRASWAAEPLPGERVAEVQGTGHGKPVSPGEPRLAPGRVQSPGKEDKQRTPASSPGPVVRSALGCCALGRVPSPPVSLFSPPALCASTARKCLQGRRRLDLGVTRPQSFHDVIAIRQEKG